MLLFAFGTRPEWLKIRPIIDEIGDDIPYKILFTGQHSSLVDIIAREYECIQLEIDDHCDIRLDSIVYSILHQIPSNMYGAEYVIVQGDTTSAYAVALAAFHRQIPVIHVEAGLRTQDINNPYPEEFNRRSISAMAFMHLCPTMSNAFNLIREFLQADYSNNIHIVGNTALDNLLLRGPIEVHNFVLVTMHRRENHANIKEWFTEINKIAGESENEFIMPIHPSPAITAHKDILTNVTVIDPVSHTKCIDMIRRCKYVITDSGGIQEESSFLCKKSIVCRKTTEREEGLGLFSFLCLNPADLKGLVKQIEDSNEFVVDAPCPYGDGHASTNIVDIFRQEFL